MGQCEKGRGRALASKDFLYAHALVHWGHANDPLSHSARGVQTVGARACSSRRRRELRQLRCPTHRLVQIHGFRVQGPGSRVQGTPTHSLFPPRQHACRRRCHYRHRPAPTEQDGRAPIASSGARSASVGPLTAALVTRRGRVYRNVSFSRSPRLHCRGGRTGCIRLSCLGFKPLPLGRRRCAYLRHL